MNSDVIDTEISGRVKLELEVTQYNAEDGTFTMRANIRGLNTGRNNMHAGFASVPANLSAEAAKIDEAHSTVTFGGKIYTLSEEWGCRQIVVTNT